jgi:hypothetical protein
MAGGKPIFVEEVGWKEPLRYNDIILVSAVLGI